MKLLKGKRLKSEASRRDQLDKLCRVYSLSRWVSINFDRWIKIHGKVASSGMCYRPGSHTVVEIEELSMAPLGGCGAFFCPHLACLGCWRNGFNRPVLKHGPRSLTCLRVFGWKALVRNESEKLRSLSWRASTPGPKPFVRWICGRACMLGPERW